MTSEGVCVVAGIVVSITAFVASAVVTAAIIVTSNLLLLFATSIAASK